jgi:hypothetical protein
LIIKDMDDSSEDEISENSDVDLEDSDTDSEETIKNNELLMKTQWLCGDGRPSVFVCSIC